MEGVCKIVERIVSPFRKSEFKTECNIPVYPTVGLATIARMLVGVFNHGELFLPEELVPFAKDRLF